MPGLQKAEQRAHLGQRSAWGPKRLAGSAIPRPVLVLVGGERGQRWTLPVGGMGIGEDCLK